MRWAGAWGLTASPSGAGASAWAQPTGLNLDKELPGLVASPAWKKARFHQAWHEGDTLSVAIGQGYNLATPIQMARVAAAIANGGIIYKPISWRKWRARPGRFSTRPSPRCNPAWGPARPPWKRCARAWRGWSTNGHGQGRPPLQYPGGRQDRHRPGGRHGPG